ncbi:MAG: hypothetical protein MZW92_09345 [Comamonadaceae bacterium]|nr:hypothetical protein [Comamonadaceae bacterium]
MAAEKNPRQVAGFEMDRLTPFAAAQVYYDVIVLERQPEQRRLRVELTALPRAGVEPVLAQLRQQGLQPDALDVAGGRPGLNLLPPEQRVRRDYWGRRLRTAVMAATLLLVAAAMILPIWQQRLLVMGMMTKVGRLQQAANQALTLRDQLDRDPGGFPDAGAEETDPAAPGGFAAGADRDSPGRHLGGTRAD